MAMTWSVHPMFETLLAAHGIRDARDLIQVATAEELRKPGLEAWRRRFRLVLGEGTPARTVLYIKQYLRPPQREVRVARRHCPGVRTLAAVEWRWIGELEQHGIACPVRVALGEDVRDGVEFESVCVTSQVQGISLERWLAEMPARMSPSHSDVRAMIKPLASLVRRLHEVGLVHRDLYASHIFVDTSTTPPTMTLIDLQRIMRPFWWRHRRVVKDLAALNYSCPPDRVSRCDRVRWLKVYLRTSRLTPADRRLVRRIEAKTRRIARHDANRRRRAVGPPGQDTPSPSAAASSRATGDKVMRFVP